MTDKQIIIDSIDVSKCKYFDYYYKECKAEYYTRYGYEIVKCDSCKDNPNCYYKQLKRKEQECEKLKQTLTEIKEIAKNTIKNVSDRCIETTPMYSVHKQILQKISKCEVENGN